MPFVGSFLPLYVFHPSCDLDYPFNSSNRRARRLVNTFDGEHVFQSSLAWRRRLLVVADAVGEMLRLDLELIWMFLRAHLLDRLSIDFAVQPEAFVVKSGFHH